MRTSGFFAGALLCALSSAIAQAEPFLCAGYEPVRPPSEAASKPTAKTGALPSRGRVNVLVAFAQFADEAPAPLPEFAAALFDSALPGSFTHFYHTMSFGQLQVEGRVLPKRYVSDQPAAAYLAGQEGEKGRYGQFALEILKKVDGEIDLDLFDNDGPDGLPNSGDDDGVVDYVFLNLRSVPRHFILGRATGVGGLGFEEDYSCADRTANGGSLRISGLLSHGCLLEEGTFAQTVGSMAHEFGHSLGLPDLYDLSYEDPSEDSAGIGRWGLMGWGAHGWHGDDGPNPLCAWSRERLGWAGRDNERLFEVSKDTAGLVIADLYQGGCIYKVPLRAEVSPGGVFYQEYLLMEQRVRTSNHYNRNLPGEGLLIWHIRPLAENNDQEGYKIADLVCADGLYQDAGFPLGRMPDPYQGRDNLDFWAHDPAYAEVHGGNLGDEADLFDGVRFTRLDLGTNPSTHFQDSLPLSASTGLSLRNIRPQGAAMRTDVILPRWAGTIREEVHWVGEILVDGDVTIAPEGKLVLYPASQVRFAGADRLQGGRDPWRCEVRVQGELSVYSRWVIYYDKERGKWKEVRPEPVQFEALVPGDTWYGLFSEVSARVEVPDGSLVVRDAEHGWGGSGRPPEEVASSLSQSTAVLAEAGELPGSVQLLPNFPNPFNPQTTIRYALPVSAQVTLKVHNALGQVVRTLVEGLEPAGMHSAMWDGRDEGGREMAGGVYFYRLEAEGGHAASQQMALVR